MLLCKKNGRTLYERFNPFGEKNNNGQVKVAS